MANNLDYSSWLGRIHSRIDPFSLLHFSEGFDLNAIYLNYDNEPQKEIKSLQFDIAVLDKNLTCPICLDPLEDNAVKLPMCQHCYHRDCITKWLKQKLVCPVCCRDFPSSHITYVEPSKDKTKVSFVLTYNNGQLTYNNGQLTDIELYNSNYWTNQLIAEEFINLLYQTILPQIPNITQDDLTTALTNNQNDYIEALFQLTADKNRAYEILSHIPYHLLSPVAEKQNMLARILPQIETHDFFENDLKLILEHTNCSIKQVIETLHKHDGDIINTIMELNN